MTMAQEYGLNKIFNEMFDKRFDDRKCELTRETVALIRKLAKRLAETGDASLVAKELDDLLNQIS